MGLLSIIALTVALFVATSPDKTITASNLPGGVNLNVRGAPTATKEAPLAVYVPTAAPTPTPSQKPAELTATPATTLTPQPTAIPEPPTPTPTPAPVGVVPARLRIPSIGVDAPVVEVKTTKSGAMDTPKSIWDIGWYEPGTKPGGLGSAVMTGHVDGPNTPAIFWDLKKVKAGEKIYVQDQKGTQLTFEVVETEIYPYDEAPLDRIFVTNDDVYLNLITCNGTFDRKSNNYDKRLVVYTKLIKEGE